MLFLVLEYSLQFHWIICFVLLLWFRLLSLWCSGCFGCLGCLKIKHTTLRAMITDSMALLWTAGIPPWVLTLVQSGLRPFDQSVDYHWGPITLLSTLDPEHAIERSVLRIERVFFWQWPGSFYWFGLCLRSVSLMLYVSLDSRTIIGFDLWSLDILW